MIVVISIYLGLIYIKSITKKRTKKINRLKKNTYRKISYDLQEIMNDKEIDNILSDIGLKINVFRINLIRTAILSIYLIVIITIYLKTEYNISKYFIGLIILFFITLPKMQILGQKTPFALIVNYIRKEYQNRKDNEIFIAITQLKNLAIAQQQNPLGADFIIEQLTKFTVIIKPIFTQTLSWWRLGKEEQACDYFSDSINTKLGKEFANILIKLDSINPIELVDQLKIYQMHVREERKTKKLKKQEMISNFLFMPILFTAFIIMMNFIVIVVWIDAMKNIINL